MKGRLARPFFILPGRSEVFLALLIAAVWEIYAYGIHGTFLFDDFNNLSAIGAYGQIKDWKALLFYVTSGEADLTGRPLSLLTFLLDADRWPADPAPFKRTNILLHLLNCLLLVWVLLKLGRRTGAKEIHAQKAAVLGSALWALHPLFVSTTLYVVQREAMLPATFTLVGILLWETGRQRLLSGVRGGLTMMLAGVWGCTILATLSKGNGILLPLLIGVVEFALPDPAIRASQPNPITLGRIRMLLVGLPSALLLIWMAAGIPGDILTAAKERPWSMAQRLLTEPRVLTDYLRMLWTPRATLSGLFYDDFPVSESLLHPWTTVPAILLITSLAVAGFRLRKSAPQWSFAILFYLVGHLLESTVIPLELFFEHRNYLPALPMFWPLALWLTGDGSLQRIRYCLAVALPVLLAILTYERVNVWGAPYDQALLWADVAPDSPRAQVNAATYESAHGRPDLAVRRLQQAIAKHPDDAQLAFNLIDAECRMGRVSSQSLTLAAASMENRQVRGEFITNWLMSSIENAAEHRCAGFDLDSLSGLLDAAKRNPVLTNGPFHQADIDNMEGRLLLARGDGLGALAAFNASLDDVPTPDLALAQASMLGAAGFPELGMHHLQYFHTLKVNWPPTRGMKVLHRWLLIRDGYWSKDIVRVEAELRADTEAKTRNPSIADRKNSSS